MTQVEIEQHHVQCLGCAKMFVPTLRQIQMNSKFCTRDCYLISYRANNKERLKIIQRRWKQNNPQKRVYNPELNRKYCKKWSEKNKSRARQLIDNWVANNPERADFLKTRFTIAKSLGLKTTAIPDELVEARVALIVLRRLTSAKAIEAGTVETERLDAKHESAGLQGFAQNPNG
jgi:hypothetical protein